MHSVVGREVDAIVSAFAGLPADEELHVACDREPRILRREFEKRFPGGFIWEQRRVGSDRWEIAVRRAAGATGGDPARSLLDRCAIFAAATPRTRSLLAGIALRRRFEKNKPITEQDADWPFLGAVENGHVYAIAVTSQGREQVLFEMGESEIFGDVILFDRGATIARFVTLNEPAQVLLFPRDDVLGCAVDDPAFALALAASCAQRVRGLIELVCAHVSKPIVARVASALLRYAPPEPGLAPVDPALLPLLRLSPIAAAAGTVKEVVARAFNELEAAGAIKRMGGRIALVDRAILETFL